MDGLYVGSNLSSPTMEMVVVYVYKDFTEFSLLCLDLVLVVKAPEGQAGICEGDTKYWPWHDCVSHRPLYFLVYDERFK